VLWCNRSSFLFVTDFIGLRRDKVYKLYNDRDQHTKITFSKEQNLNKRLETPNRIESNTTFIAAHTYHYRYTSKHPNIHKSRHENKKKKIRNAFTIKHKIHLSISHNLLGKQHDLLKPSLPFVTF